MLNRDKFLMAGCMAQRISAEEDGRTESERAEFDAMLAAIGDLYLTAHVLILMDTSCISAGIRSTVFCVLLFCTCQLIDRCLNPCVDRR